MTAVVRQPDVLATLAAVVDGLAIVPAPIQRAQRLLPAADLDEHDAALARSVRRVISDAVVATPHWRTRTTSPRYALIELDAVALTDTLAVLLAADAATRTAGSEPG